MCPRCWQVCASKGWGAAPCWHTTSKRRGTSTAMPGYPLALGLPPLPALPLPGSPFPCRRAHIPPAAIADPNANNKSCLDTLLATVFVNTSAGGVGGRGDVGPRALLMPHAVSAHLPGSQLQRTSLDPTHPASCPLHLSLPAPRSRCPLTGPDHPRRAPRPARPLRYLHPWPATALLMRLFTRQRSSSTSACRSASRHAADTACSPLCLPCRMPARRRGPAPCVSKCIPHDRHPT